MKLTILVAVLFAFAQSNAQVSDKEFDSVLAKKLNADAYGMKKYQLVILKTGPTEIKDSIKLDSIFNGHMKNIQLLASENKLVIAGPLGRNDKNYRGIFILNTDNISEAEKMVASDPAVQSKVFTAEFYPWYASAALQQISEIHKKIQKEHF